MNEAEDPVARQSTRREPRADLLEQYGCGPIRFSGSQDALYERHLLFDDVVDPVAAGGTRTLRGRCPVGQGCAVATLGADRAAPTIGQNPKRIYYLSMEFLIGRSLANNVTNLLLDPFVKRAADRKETSTGSSLHGAGARCRAGQRRTRPARRMLPRTRWRRCNCPAMGYGLRYEYGMFKQTIEDGWQREAAGQLAAPP